jgi:16S rRNA (adenine1518-N6/adenine1519-N6)-dimethyltransferase
MIEPVQTKTQIRETLESIGAAPTKRFGQHFLIDGNLMRRLADSAEMTREDVVLEVGPGTGGLTDLLVGRAGRVVAVEIDYKLAALLRERFADFGTIRILEADVLAGKHEINPVVFAALREEQAICQGRSMLVANLPYNVATPLLINLMLDVPDMQRFCFTVQRDVADRIAARPKTKEYGPVSIAIQATSQVKRIAAVPASAFWPAPKVESTILRVDRDPKRFADNEKFSRFVAFVRLAFQNRRKKLRRGLAGLMEPEALGKVETKFNLDARPEELAVEEWVALFGCAK